MRGRETAPFILGKLGGCMRYIFLITGIRTAGVDTVYRLAIIRKASAVG